MPRATGHTTALVQRYQASGFRCQLGKTCLIACQAIHTSATQRVHRGTNRPSGKRYKKRENEAAPRRCRKSTVNPREGYLVASASRVNTNVDVPNVSSAREVSNPIRSSDLRQKTRAATAQHTAAKPVSNVTR